MQLIELIKGNKATFIEFHSGTLFYEVNGFRFPIPVEELQGASIKAEEKASVFLKWIRKALKEVENG